MEAMYTNELDENSDLENVIIASASQFELTVTQKILNIYAGKKTLDLNNYKLDGFRHICNVCEKKSTSDKWYFKDIDSQAMFEDHKSWVYVIAIDNSVVFKVGESGNPLGWRSNSTREHPQPSTKGRLSRYIGGDGTDKDIRVDLDIFLNYGHTISFWAKKCDIIQYPTTLLGNTGTTAGSTHKDLEMKYLDLIYQEICAFPFCNKSRK